jgi:hypothetical protein
VHHLQGHQPVEADVVSEVYARHAAATEAREQDVLAGCAGLERVEDRVFGERSA